MPQEFTDIFAFSLSTGEIIANIGVALICGLLMSQLYRWSYRGTSYSATFATSLVTLAMITAVIMMSIGNNLARAFGLVGAMSIIRFRTAIKDTGDLVFIFLALAIGLAAGVGFHRLALLATVVVGATIFVLSRSNYASLTRREYLLEFTADEPPENGLPPGYQSVLEDHCRHHRLLNVRGEGAGRIALSFMVELRSAEDSQRLIRDLARLPDTARVNMFFDDEHL